MEFIKHIYEDWASDKEWFVQAALIFIWSLIIIGGGIGLIAGLLVDAIVTLVVIGIIGLSVGFIVALCILIEHYS